MGVLERFWRAVAGGQSVTMRGQMNGAQVRLSNYYRPAGDCESIHGWTIEKLWKTQPHLRTVVDFVAQQIASIGVHVFDRAEDGDRVRVTDSPLVRLLADPNSEQTGPEFIYSIVHEIALYDDAYLLLALDKDGRPRARLIPTPWVTVETGPNLNVTGYIVNGKRIDPGLIVRFPGWTPGDPSVSTSPVETLRTILDSEHASHARRRNFLVRGPHVGGVIQRPLQAPAWTDAARRIFDETWAAFQPGGERAGDAVLLEDGMTYTPPTWVADDNGYKDGSVLSLSTVAQVFHIHPSILGVPGAVGYSGVREIRRALIGDALAWQIKRIESRLTKVLGARLGEPDTRYAEFNVEGKLRGSFEEQAVILRQSVGAPYLTVNEARAMFNRAALDGGDDLIRPLNVTVEGESHRSPEDDAAQLAGMKQAVIDRFLERRDRVIAAKRGGGGTVDVERWIRELGEDALKAGVAITAEEICEVNADLAGGE